MHKNQYQSQLDQKYAEIQQIRSILVGWEETASYKQLKLFLREYQNNKIKLGKIVGHIHVNFEKAEKYYSECFEAQKNCRTICEDLIRLEDIDENTCILLFRTKSQFLVSAREVIFVHTKRRISPTETVIFKANAEGYQNIPVNQDAVRADGKIYAVFLKKISEEETELEVYFLMDPKGSIPSSLVNLLIKQQLYGFVKDQKEINKL